MKKIIIAALATVLMSGCATQNMVELRGSYNSLVTLCNNSRDYNSPACKKAIELGYQISDILAKKAAKAAGGLR